LSPPKAFKIPPSTDALRYATAQETPPGWPPSQPSHSPQRLPSDSNNFSADFELFPESAPAPSTKDAVFNLGYTTSLPAARNWSAAAAAAASAVQRSPFVPAQAEFNPALIETLSDAQRTHLIREFGRRQRNMEEELLTLAALEASPLQANDMTFSPNNPLFHDFSPFIGTIPYTGRTNDTLDDSPTGLDTPLFGADDAALDDWTPLFSNEEQINFANPPAPVPMEHTPSTDALINPAALMLGAEASTPPLSAIIPSRQFSTDSNKSRSPPSPKKTPTSAKRASLTGGGVSRRKPVLDLPPVQFDPTNPVDIKRARNTMAARKSRARRVEKMEELAEAVDKLQAEAQQLKEEREYYKNLARQHGALVD
jgi:hypothetical protein